VSSSRANVLRAILVAGILVAIATVGFLVNRHPPQDGVVKMSPAAQEGNTSPRTKPASDRPPSLLFTDITQEAGLRFTHVNGAYGERLMPETIGSGAAFFDYDNDGDQDIFLVNFRYWPDHPGAERPTQALYRNDGTGRFEDVTEEAGLALESYGMGVAVGDIDADGWTDLYLTSLKRNHLFRNVEGRFEEISETSGTEGQPNMWSTSAGFLDYDRDGDLDLFVVNYVDWSRKIDLEIDFRLAGLGRAYGAPTHFTGTDNYLFRNEGDGRFTDVSTAAGMRIHDPVTGYPVGKGLGLVPVDYDRDGWLDLVVANDTVRNLLFRNRGDGSFEEVGAFEGIAYDRQGKPTGGMGIDAGHFRNDQDLGIVIGNFANEMSSLYMTVDGKPPFTDEAVLEGLGPDTRPALTFGTLFVDVDLDGRLDLVQANGHLEHEINKIQPNQHYAQPTQLFWNCGRRCRGQFVLATDTGDLPTPLVGRAATYADIDDDGDPDLLLTQNGRPTVLYRNDQQTGHHWLRVKLVGRPPNRDAIGARLRLSVDGVTQYREVMPTRSYLAQIELPLTFGLGHSTKVERLEIEWPDGSLQTLVPEQIDTTLTIKQPGPGQ
jgi:hypothetical protein